MKTIQELEAMSDDELRVMLAMLCGWEKLSPPEPLIWTRDGVKHVIGYANWRDPSTRLKRDEDLPNYPADLNVLEPIEEKILRTDADRYINQLRDFRGIHWGFCSSRQRTIALIATLQPQ